MKHAGNSACNGRTGAGASAAANTMPDGGGETDGPNGRYHHEDGDDKRPPYDPSRMRDASYGTTCVYDRRRVFSPLAPVVPTRVVLYSNA